MLRDYFLNKIENAIELAIKEGKLGQMSEYTKGSLIVEKPKNTEFGDLAVNVSSLARVARIAPPMIANGISIAPESTDKRKLFFFENPRSCNGYARQKPSGKF